MRSAGLWQYSLPMESGVVLRDHRLKQRKGVIICLKEDGREGWGEVAPLPGFSTESLEEASLVVDECLSLWLNGGMLSAQTGLPSVDFGLSCAQAELKGTLPNVTDYRVAPLCTGDPDVLIMALSALTGEHIAKVKVGEYEAVRDGMVVNLLLNAVPGLQLRLDANRRWTAEKAQQFARYIDPVNRRRIAFIEEPCRTRDLSRAFARETGIAIAWDESLREPGFEYVSEPGVRAVVIKPMLTGSLETICAMTEAAHRAGLQAVISSSLESSLGLSQLSRLASWLTPGIIPGLDTLSLMQAQLIRPWPGSALLCLNTDSLERVR